MVEYREKLKALYPDYTDEELEEVYESRKDFREGIIKNFDLFYS